MGWISALLLWCVVDGIANDEARWVRHTVRSQEPVLEVLERYGATPADMHRWNADLSMDALPKKGDVLRLQIRTQAPPRQRRTIKVRDRDEDTWDSIAQRWSVGVDDLRRWNPRYARRKELPKGAVLSLWLDSRIRRLPPFELGAPLPEFPALGQGSSVGHPHRGRLEAGVPLPTSELYTVRKPRLAYGTSLTVRGVQRAVAGFRSETGFDGDVAIGAMSRRTGRRLQPHRSHQSGRDVDVRLPAMRNADGEPRLQPHEIDWHASWALVEAFVRTQDVQVIFLERKFFRRLKQAGMRLGASDERIERVFDHLRHAKGHVAHFHVRFVCGPADERCRDEAR